MARMDVASRDVADGAAPSSAPETLFELGLKYCSGRDVDIDLIAAHKWFNLAAMRGSEDAKRYRLEIAGEMSRAEIAEAQRQAREWLQLH